MKLANASLNREGHEDKKSVGSDALQHVDVLMLEAAAEFQFVLSAHPAQGSVVVICIFVSATRSGDRSATVV